MPIAPLRTTMEPVMHPTPAAAVSLTTGKSQPLRWPARRFVLAVVTAVGLYLCFPMSVPLLPALTWALALTVFTWPIHRWISARVTNLNLAATLSVVAVLVILVVPSAVIAVQLGQELRTTVANVRGLTNDGGIQARLA